MTETSGAVDILYWTLWEGTQRITCDAKALRRPSESFGVERPSRPAPPHYRGSHNLPGMKEQQQDCGDVEKYTGLGNLTLATLQIHRTNNGLGSRIVLLDCDLLYCTLVSFFAAGER